MAHWDDARIAIEKRLADNWGTTTPIRYWSSGVPFQIPTTAYIAIQIEDFDGRQVTLGASAQLHRYTGQITIQVFVPERTGAKAADGYCDQLDGIFRRAQFQHGQSGVITCRTPSKRTVGTRDGWYQVNLVTAYQRDKIH